MAFLLKDKTTNGLNIINLKSKSSAYQDCVRPPPFSRPFFCALSLQQIHSMEVLLCLETRPCHKDSFLFFILCSVQLYQPWVTLASTTLLNSCSRNFVGIGVNTTAFGHQLSLCWRHPAFHLKCPAFFCVFGVGKNALYALFSA